MNHKELIFSILILALAILGTSILVLRGHEFANYLQEDVFVLLAQLILVSGIGGVISLALAEFTRAREKRQQLRDLQRKTFSDLVEAYHEVKRLRRLLRARAVQLGPSGTKDIVDRDVYDTLLERLNDVQLQCEFYKRYAKGNQDIYGAAGPELVANLKQAEKFLGKVISEWEKNLARFSGDPPVSPLAKLPRLAEFIDEAEKGFDPSVAQPIQNAFRSLAKEIAA
jgi:hypothetical protein